MNSSKLKNKKSKIEFFDYHNGICEKFFVNQDIIDTINNDRKNIDLNRLVMCYDINGEEYQITPISDLIIQIDNMKLKS